MKTLTRSAIRIRVTTPEDARDRRKTEGGPITEAEITGKTEVKAHLECVAVAYVAPEYAHEAEVIDHAKRRVRENVQTLLFGPVRAAAATAYREMLARWIPREDVAALAALDALFAPLLNAGRELTDDAA